MLFRSRVSKKASALRQLSSSSKVDEEACEETDREDDSSGVRLREDKIPIGGVRRGLGAVKHGALFGKDRGPSCKASSRGLLLGRCPQ